MKLATNYFYGNKVSDYAEEQGFLDYGTLAKAFPHILNNDIYELFYIDGLGYDLINGTDYDEENDEYYDVFQYYIIDERGANILQEFAPNEIIYYIPRLDMYIWGVTHFGTGWDYVLTDCPINCGYDEV